MKRQKAKITYRGWPGHLCVSHDCDFHLNTLVELGEVRIVVSTVGAYRPDYHKGSAVVRDIGIDRYYETMAFHAELEGKFWDADVSRQISFDAPWAWSKPEDEWAANKGHIAVVEEIAAKLEAGEQFTEAHD